VAAALLAALVGSACSGGDNTAARDLERATGSSDPLVTTTSTSERALTGDALVVVEQGVTSFPDPFDRAANLGGYGVVLQNPNADVMAVGVRVITRILNPEGVELVVDSTLLNAVMPNGKMALGRTLADGALTAVDVVTEPEENGGAVTRFTVRSTWPAPEEGVDVTAIYRAADGRLLSAESTTLAVVPPASDTVGQIRLLSPVPDLSTTEVFVGRGLAAQTTG